MDKEREAILYTLEDCFACDVIAEELLHDGYVIVERDLKKYSAENPALLAQYEKQNSAPVIEINGEFILPTDITSGRI